MTNTKTPVTLALHASCGCSIEFRSGETSESVVLTPREVLVAAERHVEETGHGMTFHGTCAKLKTAPVVDITPLMKRRDWTHSTRTEAE